MIGHIKHINRYMYVLTNKISSTTSVGNRNLSSKGDKSPAQAEGKTTVNWPQDPQPPWFQKGCKTEVQPTNYDPYRIKLPDVVVPPLPPSNAKLDVIVVGCQSHQQQGYQQQGCQQGYQQGNQMQNQQPQQQEDKKEQQEEDPSLMGIIKGFFRRKKGGAKSSTDNFPMIDCKKQRGPCSEKPGPGPPPCLPPPKPPFPWIYVWPWLLFFGTMGAMYRYYLWKEERDRLSDSKPIWRPRVKVRRPCHEQDLPYCVQYLIVGTGTAGWAAYETIMQLHPTAKVFMVTREDCLPYNRLPLSKHMWFNKEPPNMKDLNYIEDGQRKSMFMSACRKFMDPVKFFRKEIGPALGIASGWCVLRVDPEEHVIYIKSTCGERPMYYERCLLATGSRPKNIMAFKTAPKKLRDKVCTMRTIRDLEIAYRRVKEAKHVTIVGGGFLGSEIAWHLAKRNQFVKKDDEENPMPELLHVIKDKGILAGVIPEYLGEWALEKIKSEGVKTVTKAQVHDAFLTPDDRIQLTLSNGATVITDFVFVAVGAVPRTEIAEKSNLEVDQINGGFLVNTELQARKNLFVAGDAASVYTEYKDTRMRFQHYGNALETGRLAATNMTGFWDTSNIEPHFMLQLGNVLDVEAVGEVGACMPTIGLFKQCEDAEDPADKSPASATKKGDVPCFKKTSEYKNRYKRGLLFYLRDEYIVGMVFWNVPPVDDRKGVVAEMLRSRPTYKDINLLAELLGFPETQCVYVPEAEKDKEEVCLTNVRQW